MNMKLIFYAKLTKGGHWYASVLNYVVNTKYIGSSMNVI